MAGDHAMALISSSSFGGKQAGHVKSLREQLHTDVLLAGVGFALGTGTGSGFASACGSMLSLAGLTCSTCFSNLTSTSTTLSETSFRLTGNIFPSPVGNLFPTSSVLSFRLNLPLDRSGSVLGVLAIGFGLNRSFLMSAISFRHSNSAS